MYKMDPAGLSRCIIYDIDGKRTDDEIIVYLENSIKPYHPRDVQYDQDRLLAEVDEHKLMTGAGLWKGRAYFSAAANVWKSLAPYAGLIVAGLVLVYAFIS